MLVRDFDCRTEASYGLAPRILLVKQSPSFTTKLEIATWELQFRNHHLFVSH